jgi:hypothetical protein
LGERRISITFDRRLRKISKDDFSTRAAANIPLNCSEKLQMTTNRFKMPTKFNSVEIFVNDKSPPRIASQRALLKYW